MKRKLFLIAALATCVQPSALVAAVVDFYATKDTAINGFPGEDLASGGAATQVRASKFRQHAALIDFDWTAIANEILNSPTPLVSAQLRLTEAGDGIGSNPVSIVASYINGNTGAGDKDWDEGDSTNYFTPFSWSLNTYSAVSRYPSLINDGATLTTDGDIWLFGDFEDNGSFWNYDQNGQAYVNTNEFAFTAGVPNETLFVDLDLELIEEQALTDLTGDGVFYHQAFTDGTAVPAGIFTHDSSASFNNGEIFLRESGLDTAPMIRLTFAPAPEPASLGLCMLAGLGLGFRRFR